MNIRELFKEMQETFSDGELNGNIILQKNAIVWSYSLNDSEEGDDDDFEFGDDDDSFDFNTPANEELLQDAYAEDLERIEELLDETDEDCLFTVTDAEITEKRISFRIT
jgi:hypothetical protein